MSIPYPKPLRPQPQVWSAPSEVSAHPHLRAFAEDTPLVVMVGGMDRPRPTRLLDAWYELAAALGLADHRLIIVTLTHRREKLAQQVFPSITRHEVSGRDPAPGAQPRTAEQSYLARCSAQLATWAMRQVDQRTRFAPGGLPETWLTRRYLAFTPLPIAYLYTELGAWQRAQLLPLLQDRRLRLVVGASFGGSVAFDGLITACQANQLPNAADVTLITLGSNLGRTLTKGGIYQDLPHDADGRIAAPPFKWRHFASPSDFAVAASNLPEPYFAGVRSELVDTGSMLCWPPTKPHSFRRYLALDVVRSAVRDAIGAQRAG